ncbi:helix-turn-helix transcriptional regulator [Nocardia sp. NPDC051030]|uniref:helix-turn-helix domain-containing protein n=1 Tax=Nocardia sp. NPDC051030 TaxID=3155162 RepID=UPI003428D14C
MKIQNISGHYPLHLRPSCSPHECPSWDLLVAAGSEWSQGNATSALSLAAAAAAATCEFGGELCSTLAGMQFAQMLINVRRLGEARQAVRHTAAMAADPRVAGIAALLNSRIALTVGDVAEAIDLCSTGLAVVDELRLSPWKPIGNIICATNALRSGDVATMVHHANQLKEDVLFGRDMFAWNSPAWLIVRIAEAEQGRDAAVPLARELLESETATRRLLLAEPTSVSFLVRMMLDVHERDIAAPAVAHATALAAENPDIPVLAAGALHARGLLENDVDLLRQAAEGYGDAWARASVAEDIATVLAAQGQPTRQICDQYETAMRTYAAAGALYDSSRVRSKLRGYNRSMATARFWPSSRIPGLTDTEYTVAKLVSEGLTNAEVAGQMYLSRHTVAFHLRKIFQKVGAKSRLELALMWNDLAERGHAPFGRVPAGRASA